MEFLRGILPAFLFAESQHLKPEPRVLTWSRLQVLSSPFMERRPNQPLTTSVAPDEATSVAPDEATSVAPDEATEVVPDEATEVVSDEATEVVSDLESEDESDEAVDEQPPLQVFQPKRSQPIDIVRPRSLQERYVAPPLNYYWKPGDSIVLPHYQSQGTPKENPRRPGLRI
jgi:hypothetical protein